MSAREPGPIVASYSVKVHLHDPVDDPGAEIPYRTIDLINIIHDAIADDVALPWPGAITLTVERIDQ